MSLTEKQAEKIIVAELQAVTQTSLVIAITDLQLLGERIHMAKFTLNGYGVAGCIIENQPGEYMFLLPSVYLTLFMPRYTIPFLEPKSVARQVVKESKIVIPERFTKRSN